jgi:Ssp1 endopeptidase immunity protein Rap1a
MRKRHAIGIAAAVAVLGQQGAAVAQPNNVMSANYVMPGCRDAVNQNDNSDRIYLRTTCNSIIRTMFYFSKSHFGICAPGQSTVGQAIRVVVAYVDQRPERMHEHFEGLALEALQRAWPCRR